MNLILVGLVLSLFFSAAWTDQPIARTRDASPTQVVIVGRQLRVNGKPFVINGVGYAPVPIGQDPTIPPYEDYFTVRHRTTYLRDLRLLRQMGANVVRLWGWNNGADHSDFLDAAWNRGINPIYVLAPFWINASADISSEAGRARLSEDFRKMVAGHKDHPAVLMWILGNELNAPWMLGDKLDDLFGLLDRLAETAHREEGAHFHPVTTPLVDIETINTISNYEGSMKSLDVWGLNVYRGRSFGNLFKDYAAASTKPLVILEYGIDAYDDRARREDADMQAGFARSLWKEIAANGATCIGGTIMAYRDEWWKGNGGQARGSCPDADPTRHSDCGYPSGAMPDGYANEEWWGIVSVRDNGIDQDIVTPRPAYFALQSLWNK